MMQGKRTFNGKQYIFVGNFQNKSEARREARGIRERGNLARITRTGGKRETSYDVWHKRK